MLKHEGLRWGAVAVLAGLLVVPEAALAAGRAASTRSDGSVSSRGGSSGGSSGSSSAGTASRASSGGSQSSGRVAVPRDSGGSERSGGTSATSRGSAGNQAPRVAVPRTTDEGRRGPDRTHGRRPVGRDGRTVVIGGWWADPWFYAPHWGVWSSWWWPWAPGVYGYGYGQYRDYERQGDGFGALDTDIWPEEAEVWVDGERIGTADDFDGFPSYLWLPEGTYDVVFYFPGYRSLARQYSIYRGVIVDVEDRLERGDAVHPNEMQSTSTINRDARLQRNREREEAARAREGWRERSDRRSAAIEADELPLEGDAEGVARLHLRVTPADASVYLDGNFFGTARELEQLSAGLVVAPGSHRLQVVRPGFRSEEVVFDSDPGEALELRVDLESE